MKFHVKDVTHDPMSTEVDFLNSKIEMLERELRYYANKDNYEQRKVVPIMSGLKTSTEIPILKDQGFRARIVLGIEK